MKIKLSPWMDVEGYEWCSMRILDGSDPKDVKNRYAFIEKYGRVRIAPLDPDSASADHLNWKTVYRGSAPEYGHKQETRDACDCELLAMGYELS